MESVPHEIARRGPSDEDVTRQLVYLPLHVMIDTPTADPHVRDEACRSSSHQRICGERLSLRCWRVRATQARTCDCDIFRRRAAPRTRARPWGG